MESENVKLKSPEELKEDFEKFETELSRIRNEMLSLFDDDEEDEENSQFQIITNEEKNLFYRLELAILQKIKFKSSSFIVQVKLLALELDALRQIISFYQTKFNRDEETEGLKPFGSGTEGLNLKQGIQDLKLFVESYEKKKGTRESRKKAIEMNENLQHQLEAFLEKRKENLKKIISEV